MDRAQMIEALAALGYDVSLITDATPDEVLAEMLRVMQAQAPEEVPAEEVPAEEVPAEAPPEAAMAEVVPAAAPAPAPAPAAAGIPTATPNKVVLQYSEANIRKIVDAEIAKREAQIRQRERINVFCERMRTEVKLLPAHLDKEGDKPTMKDVLEAIAEGRSVTKFSEGTKKLSPLELLMKVIENGPSLARFSELVRDPQQSKGVDKSKVSALLAHTPAGKKVLARQAAAK